MNATGRAAIAKSYNHPPSPSNPFARAVAERLRGVLHAPQEPNRSSCPLLNLPLELREMIYELALCNPGDITFITASGYSRGSGLLSTCTQIRQEATQIFYAYNSFKILVGDCDATPMVRWYESLEEIPYLSDKVRDNVDMKAYLRWEPNWENLMKWCQVAHEGKKKVHVLMAQSLKKSGSSPVDAGLFLVAGMFKTLAVMLGQEWEVVERVLEVQRTALVANDKRWKVEEEEEKQ